MSYLVKQIESAPLTVLGEGPHWDIERQSLYFNDIYGGTIHRFDYASGKTYNCKIGKLDIFFVFFLHSFTVD